MLGIAAAIGGTLANLGVGFLTKPKKKHYRPDLSYLDKYVANLRGDLAKRTVERNILRQGATHIGDISREQMQQAEYEGFRTGTAGTGVQAAQRLEIGRGAQAAMADVTAQAGQQTAEQAAITTQQIREIELHKEQIKSQAAADYDRAKSQWKREMIGTGIQGAVNIGMAGAQHAAQMKDATAIAQAQGGYGTPQEAREALKATGASTLQGQLQALGISQDKEKQKYFFDAITTAMGITDAVWDPKLGEKNFEVLEANRQYQFNKSVEELFHFATTYDWEPMEILDYIDREMPDIPIADKLATMNKIVDYQRSRAGEAEEGLYSDYLRGIVQEHEGFEWTEGIASPNILRQILSDIGSAEGARRKELLDDFERRMQPMIDMGDYTMNDLIRDSMAYGIPADVYSRLRTSIRTVEKAQETEAKAIQDVRTGYLEFANKFSLVEEVGGDEEIKQQIKDFAYSGTEGDRIILTGKIDQWLKSLTPEQLVTMSRTEKILAELAANFDIETPQDFSKLDAALQRAYLQSILTRELKIGGIGEDMSIDMIKRYRKFDSAFSEVGF